MDQIARDLLIFNDKAYAELGTPLLPACNGYFKKKGQEGVLLYKRNAELAAFIVDNKKQGRFIVNAHLTSEGPRYMFAASEETEQWLGLDPLHNESLKTQAIADMAIVSRERIAWTLQGKQEAEAGPAAPALPPSADLPEVVAQRDALCAAAHDLLVCEFKAWRFSGFQDHQIMAMPYLKPLLRAVEAVVGQPFSMEEAAPTRERMRG